jgi:hypothetical protein
MAKLTKKSLEQDLESAKFSNERLAYQVSTLEEELKKKSLPLVTPTIHLNGSGRNALVEKVCCSMDGVRKAIEALSDASPHGRDYYPQGNDAYLKAELAWQQRLGLLRDLYKELVEHAQEIDESGRKK